VGLERSFLRGDPLCRVGREEASDRELLEIVPGQGSARSASEKRSKAVAQSRRIRASRPAWTGSTVEAAAGDKPSLTWWIVPPHEAVTFERIAEAG
jgi:hypothetical protein